MSRVVSVRTGLLLGLVCAAGLGLLVGGCPSQIVIEDGATTVTLTLGTKQQLQSSIVPTGGGTVTLSQEGHALDGLTIEVPDGAYAADTTFTISEASVTEHNLGEKFNALTPLITIDNGGGYADGIIKLTIPITRTLGRFPMAFYYDAEEGTLEGLPTLSADDTSITICTRHFSDIVVSEVAFDLLLGDVTTDFAVTQDNWQFLNLGTYLVPGGSCSGMSVAAMFYWDVLKRGRGALYGRYDNNGDTPATPNLDFDDSDVIKLCGEAQFYESNWIEQSHEDWVEKGKNHNDLWAFYMFAYSMLVSERPQYVAIFKEGDNGAAGHALIVYKKSGYSLWVADPNEKANGDLKFTVNPDTGEMDPYKGKWNAYTPELQFDEMMYFGRGVRGELRKSAGVVGRARAGQGRRRLPGVSAQGHARLWN